MRFGGIVALHEVSLSARAGHITAVIGPNGAGKTTLFNCITGMYRATGGRIEYDGRTLLRMNPHDIARSGIARTFQNLALFEGLSVFENLKIGAYQRGRTGLLEGMIISPRARREEAEAERRARETLAFLGIEDVASKRPSEPSYGRRTEAASPRAPQ